MRVFIKIVCNIISHILKFRYKLPKRKDYVRVSRKRFNNFFSQIFFVLFPFMILMKMKTAARKVWKIRARIKKL